MMPYLPAYAAPTYSLDAEPDSVSCGCVMKPYGNTATVILDLCPWAQNFTRIGTWHHKTTDPVVTAHVRRAMKYQASGYKGDTSDTVIGRKIREEARRESEMRSED